MGVTKQGGRRLERWRAGFRHKGADLELPGTKIRAKAQTQLSQSCESTQQAPPPLLQELTMEAINAEGHATQQRRKLTLSLPSNVDLLSAEEKQKQ